MQLGPTGLALARSLARILGTATLSLVVAGVFALGYRWYVRERIPGALALLAGLAAVAVVVNTTPLLAREIADTGDIELLTALFNIVVFVVGGLSASLGTRIGDAAATDLFAATGHDVEADVSEIVQSVGRVTTVELPADVEDIVGYDPVPEATTETLAGRRFLFPRRLTEAELRERLVSRLKTDYGVGHVDVELDGSEVTYLAVGSRAAGIGPTLPPATNAVAVRADPAHAASAGDLVQVWETDPLQRILTGELRGVAGEVVTVAIDAADTPKLDPTERYKLVTLPVQDRPDREFASLLRAADETLATVTVQPDSPLDGATVGAVPAVVAAITRPDAQPVPLPVRDRELVAGDVLYAIGRPDTLRRVESSAVGSGEPAVAAGEPAAVTESAPEAGESASDAAGSEGESATDGSDSTPTTGEGDVPETGETESEAAESAPEAEASAGERDETVDAEREEGETEASEPAETAEDEAAERSGAETGGSDEHGAENDPLDSDAFPAATDRPGVATEDDDLPGLDADDDDGGDAPEAPDSTETAAGEGESGDSDPSEPAAEQLGGESADESEAETGSDGDEGGLAELGESVDEDLDELLGPDEGTQADADTFDDLVADEGSGTEPSDGEDEETGSDGEGGDAAGSEGERADDTEGGEGEDDAAEDEGDATKGEDGERDGRG